MSMTNLNYDSILLLSINNIQWLTNKFSPSAWYLLRQNIQYTPSSDYIVAISEFGMDNYESDEHYIEQFQSIICNTSRVTRNSIGLITSPLAVNCIENQRR